MNLHSDPSRDRKSGAAISSTLVRAGLGLGLLALANACGGADSERVENWDGSLASTVDTGSSSAACTDGEVRSCQVELGRTATDVTCFRGKQVCATGTWGECEAGTVSTEVLPNHVVAGGAAPGKGLLSYSTTAACSGTYANACDPECQFFEETTTTATVPASSGSAGGEKINGALCYYAVYSPTSTSVRGGTVNGNIAAVGDLSLGEAGAITLTGNIATCGALTVRNNSVSTSGTIEAVGNISLENSAKLVGDVITNGNISINTGSQVYGTARVGGSVTISNTNGVKAFLGNGATYTATATTEADRTVLWAAGVSPGTASSNVWANSTFANIQPGGNIQGGITSPVVPGYSETWGSASYPTWSTNGTTYSWHSMTRADVLASFPTSTNPLFTNSMCTTPTAAAVPTQDIASHCSSSNPSYGGSTTSIGPGDYGWVWINSGVKLTLTGPGTYTFYGFGMSSAATLDLLGTAGGGTYYINICDGGFSQSGSWAITFSDNTSITAATVDYTKIRWYYSGTNTVTMDSAKTSVLPGVFTAPNATVQLQPGYIVNGLIHAKSTNMDTTAAITPVTGPNPCGSGTTCTATTQTLFDQTYTATCPSGALPYWTYLTWDTTIGSGSGNADAQITFEVARGESETALATAADTDFTTLSPVAAYNATTSLDTQVCPVTGGATGCPVSLADADASSQAAIRLRATLSYGGCLTTAIDVNSWNVFYTCKDGL